MIAAGNQTTVRYAFVALGKNASKNGDFTADDRTNDPSDVSAAEQRTDEKYEMNNKLNKNLNIYEYIFFRHRVFKTVKNDAEVIFS